MVAQIRGRWIYARERGASNFNLQMWLEEEEMVPAEETKTVFCHFSLTPSKSHLVTSWKTNCMFKWTVDIGFTKFSALRSVRGGCGSAKGQSLLKIGEKLKRFCQRLSTAGWRGPANASVETSSTLATSPCRVILGETYCIASAQLQQAALCLQESSHQAQERYVLCSH